MSYFNSEQNGHMAFIASLPRDQVCPCGWETKKNCDKWRTGPYDCCCDKALRNSTPPSSSPPKRKGPTG